MDSIYWIIITALLLLAAFDLINGVANDAVNFLNSAIGSKAAPVRVILTVAFHRRAGGGLFLRRHDGSSPQRYFSPGHVQLS